MGHDIMGFLVSKFKNIVDHFRFRGKQDSLLMPFIYHGYDLFFRNILLVVIAVNAKQPEYQSDCHGNDPGKR